MIRRATAADGPAVGRVFAAARDGMPYLPRIPDRDRGWLGPHFVETAEVWVYETDAGVVGFAGLVGDRLEYLYVEPAEQSRGIGSELLDHAKRRRPEGFDFWVFQKNEAGRRFYERHGCRLVELTDGAGNMEKEPDARYEWRPAQGS